MKKTAIARIETGVRNLDALFEGGLPKGSAVVIAGPPGAGKTILTQQICFHGASPKAPVLYFNTLSEPTAKTLRYLSQFDFFDAKKLDEAITFIDLGGLLRTKGLEESAKLVMEHVKRVKPAIVVIDSFKVFDDLARSREELRKFGYELTVSLMAWEATTLLLGEFSLDEIAQNSLFSIIDGLISVGQREESGEQRRFLQIIKMRGTNHSRDEHSFVITPAGIDVFAPRLTMQRDDLERNERRLKTGISKLDELLGDGIPRGASVLLAGVAGTGKTVLSLEFIYRGAKAGEKGLYFSFEENEQRLRATARGLGWDFDTEIERGMIELVFIPQPDIMVESHLLMMREHILATNARRVVVDSVSVFLHKAKDPQIDREKIFQLASVIHNAQAVGFLATDIPYGANQISRFGVEETVVDGLILLSSTQEGLERQRYIEIYKLRNTAHLEGRHSLVIGSGGITIYPRYNAEATFGEPPPPLDTTRRLATGVPGLDELCGGGLLERSVTLLSGSAGIGKSTLSLQFILEGARRNEPGLYIALEEGPAQLIRAAEALGLPLQEAIDAGLVEVIYLSREKIRPSQFLSFLTSKIREQKTRRFVLDSVTHLGTEGVAEDELRQLLHALVTRFKALGVTSLLTFESTAMYSTHRVTDSRFSPVADNLIVLRYRALPGEIRPTLMIVKTRGSAHDFGAYDFTVSEGGIRLGPRATDVPELAKKRASRKRTKK